MASVRGHTAGTEVCQVTGRTRAPLLDKPEGQVELLLERVHARAEALLADPGERPGLHDLMRALDLIIQDGDDEMGTVDGKPSTEDANTVYRLLIKREKQKAYDSLVSIQSEIYAMQGKQRQRKISLAELF